MVPAAQRSATRASSPPSFCGELTRYVDQPLDQHGFAPWNSKSPRALARVDRILGRKRRASTTASPISSSRISVKLAPTSASIWARLLELPVFSESNQAFHRRKLLQVSGQANELKLRILVAQAFDGHDDRGVRDKSKQISSADRARVGRPERAP